MFIERGESEDLDIASLVGIDFRVETIKVVSNVALATVLTIGQILLLPSDALVPVSRSPVDAERELEAWPGLAILDNLPFVTGGGAGGLVVDKWQRNFGSLPGRPSTDIPSLHRTSPFKELPGFVSSARLSLFTRWFLLNSLLDGTLCSK